MILKFICEINMENLLRKIIKTVGRQKLTKLHGRTFHKAIIMETTGNDKVDKVNAKQSKC